MQNWWDFWCSAFVHDSVNDFPVIFGGGIGAIESGAKIIKIQDFCRIDCFLALITEIIKPYLVFILVAMLFIVMINSIFFLSIVFKDL